MFLKIDLIWFLSKELLFMDSTIENQSKEKIISQLIRIIAFVNDKNFVY